MNTTNTTNRKLKRMFANILSIVVMLAMAFPVNTVVFAAPNSSATADLASLIAAAQAEGSLTVIALPNTWCNYGSLINGFSGTYGITVTSMAPSASSADELQAIRDGGPNAPDVIDVGPGFAVQAKEEGLITPYQVSTWATIPDFMKDGDGYWYGDYYGVMAIAANSTDYASPTSWEDLLSEDNVGPVALGGDPTISNMGFFAVYAAALANGGSLDNIEPGLNFFRDLNKAGRLLSDIGNGETLASGATPVLLEWSYLALAQRDANPESQIEVVVPQPNPIASFYAQAVSAYAPHPNAARLWMEYLYSDEGQLAWLEGYCFPARFDDLLVRNEIPEDLLARLPDITSAVFPSLDQIVDAKAYLEANWNCIVYGNGCLWRDEFDGTLAEGWYWENGDSGEWSLGDEPGFLRLDVSNTSGIDGNLLLRQVQQGDFAIETHVIFEPNTNFQFAGLVIYQDEYNHLSLGRAFCDVEGACVGNGIYSDYVAGGNWVSGNFGTVVNSSNEAYLRLERRGDMVRALYSYEGITWFEIGTHWISPDFQVNGVGLMAGGDYDTSDPNISAYFDYFELTEGWGFLPEGFHDGDQGDVPSWACNVNGWAADPDDRATDLAIEVNIDGTSLPDWLYASEYREDLDNAGVCVDGNCSFSTSLWGVISSYEPHSVVVYAQDVPSGDWVQLSNSPKTLTCRTYDIYAYDPLTSTTKLITTNLLGTDEYDPTWSPNGKKVAHDVVTPDSHGIYVTDVKTGVSAPLVGAQNGGNDAAWSPNGKLIAFDRRWHGGPNIYIVSATGGAENLVKENAVNANWAPNGKRLVFQQPSDGSIRTAAVDGGKGIDTFIVVDGSEPAWSPDGNWIAYEFNGNIWKVQVNVLGKVLGTPIQLTHLNAWHVGGSTWSTDSQTIVFNAGVSDDIDLWSVPAAGGEIIWLTGAPVFGDYGPENARNSSNIAYASFSPDGQTARTWVAAFTYDLPVGYWAEGTHTYQFLTSDNSGGEGRSFDVSLDNPLYDGTTLLRPGTVRARIGDGCINIDAINPGQKTQFHVGWTADGTYSDALTYYENLMAQVAWNGGAPVDLVQHEIFPFTAPLDWWGYVCTFTTP